MLLIKKHRAKYSWMVVFILKYSLRTKLTISYVIIALICVGLISLVSNMFLEKQFREYVLKNLENKNIEVVRLVNKQYEKDMGWKSASFRNIGVHALEMGMITKITDHEGNTIWDAVKYNSGLCQQMMLHMSQNMLSRYPNWKGEYVESKYEVVHGAKVVGFVEIGYYGPFFYNDNDLAFINTLNYVFIIVGLLSLVFAFGFGLYSSRLISRPISKAASAAEVIADGYYGARIQDQSGTHEINKLTDSINNLAESLEKQEKLRRRLTEDVAHELRTPLATLQSHTEAMIDGIWKPDQDRLKSCHEEIVRIGRLVGDLEKLAKYESENLTLSITEFDIMEMLKRILYNFESDFGAKGIKVHIEGGVQKLSADKDKLSQVMVNLLSNALKYSRQGGEVEVKVESTNGEVVIHVRDNGIGIAQEDISHVFERFYRADKSRDRLTGGTGIGLSIAKAIVEAHKGRITATSELGKGTEFVVALPQR